MLCPCGAETTSQVHLVKSLKKGREWFAGATIEQLPLTIEQDKCSGCGRLAYKVWGSSALLFKQG